jgi:hypothetical protein
MFAICFVNVDTCVAMPYKYCLSDTSIAATSVAISPHHYITTSSHNYIAQNLNNSNAMFAICFVNVDTCVAMPYKYCLGDTSIAATSAAVSPHHYIATSLYRYITTSQHRHIATSPHRRITILILLGLFIGLTIAQFVQHLHYLLCHCSIAR